MAPPLLLPAPENQKPIRNLAGHCQESVARPPRSRITKATGSGLQKCWYDLALHQVGGDGRGSIVHGAHLVVGVVEARAEQIVHAGVGDDEVLTAAPLPVDHTGQQYPGVAGYVAAHLAEDLRARGFQGRPNGVDEIFGTGRLFVLVAYPQAPTDVEVLDVEAAAFELVDQLGALIDGLGVRGEFGDLAAYVLVYPDEVYAPVLQHPFGERQGLVDGDAKLAGAVTGRDVGVGLGVHVGVDAQGDTRPLAVAHGQALDVLQLGGRLDVEEQDALAEARHQLVLGLADPGEDYFLRIEPGLHRAVQLAARDDVRPRPERGEHA